MDSTYKKSTLIITALSAYSALLWAGYFTQPKVLLPSDYGSKESGIQR